MFKQATGNQKNEKDQLKTERTNIKKNGRLKS